MSARLRAGPPLGGFSPEAFSPEDPLLGGPPVIVPGKLFGVVPIPGVGVTLGGAPVPTPRRRRDTVRHSTRSDTRRWRGEGAAPADTGGRSASTSSTLRKGRASTSREE